MTLGVLFKKFGLYLLAIAIPVLLIVVYEGIIWSKNKGELQQQEQRADQQQANEQPAQIRLDKEQAADRVTRLQAARQREAQRELQRLQQMLGENEENSLLRCVILENSDECRCFDQQNTVVDVEDRRCRGLSGEQ